MRVWVGRVRAFAGGVPLTYLARREKQHHTVLKRILSLRTTHVLVVMLRKCILFLESRHCKPRRSASKITNSQRKMDGQNVISEPRPHRAPLICRRCCLGSKSQRKNAKQLMMTSKTPSAESMRPKGRRRRQIRLFQLKMPQMRQAKPLTRRHDLLTKSQYLSARAWW